MNTKKATEIWEYINEHQDQTHVEIAEALGITEACAQHCSIMWASKPRGEFIFWLQKQEICQPQT